MHLETLLKGIPTLSTRGPVDVDIADLAYDPRQATAGSLFFCIRNNNKNGHAFAADAVARGAVAVVADEPLELPGVTVVQVENATRSMALLASRFNSDPSRAMLMVGVTGTNGKTTTTYLIEAILEAADHHPAVMGTVGVKIGGQTLNASNTTPLSVELQRTLGDMRRAGHGAAVMEVSSHGLSLDRVYGIPYDVAVFTNLTQDHLDFHGSMEEYFQAKALLFRRLGKDNPKSFPVRSVLNADDPYAARFAQESTVPVLTFGVKNAADVRASDVVTRFSGTTYHVATPVGSTRIATQLVGMFNVYNSLAALTAGLSQNVPLETIRQALAQVPPVRGRFELVDEGQTFAVVVDYAHTPDGLENVLRAARPMTEKHLVAVFGCGGDRDRTKRPIMGRLAGQLADRVIITSDNPRTEDPESIVRDIEAGCAETTSSYHTVVDRKTAIETALAAAGPGDTVVIAGKGHETYQIFRDKTIHFDDAEVARDFLRSTKMPVTSAPERT